MPSIDSTLPWWVAGPLLGIGWGISDACPGPVAAQLGSGRVLAFAVATGIVAGVALQPQFAGAVERATRRGSPITATAEADVL